MVTRVTHDNIKPSRLITRLENRLRCEIQLFLNHDLIPSIRNKSNIELSAKSFNALMRNYSSAFYGLGANYSSKIANNELLSSEKDYENAFNLVKGYNETFWNKINGLSAIQRVEPHLKPSKVISMEKDRLSSEMSALVAWKSFNAGIKSKGRELKDVLRTADRRGLIGVRRKIWNKNLTAVNNQKIIFDRKPNSERTMAVKKAELKLKKGELDPNLADLFGEKFFIVWTFVTMDDETVCEECRDLETQQWDLDDPTVPNIPDDTHPNCRCRMAFAEIIED